MHPHIYIERTGPPHIEDNGLMINYKLISIMYSLHFFHNQLKTVRGGSQNGLKLIFRGA